MISIVEAVKAAREYAEQLYPQEELKQLRVEEIESSADDSRWLVTLGWPEPATRQIGWQTSGLFPTLNSTKIEALPRVYKIFTIDAETGKFLSMKMRD